MSEPRAAHAAQQNRSLEIAHVLFMDVIGYSRLTIENQRRTLEKLQDIVRECSEFRDATTQQRLTRLPTGDGMALVFWGDPEAPLRAAVELARALRAHSSLKLRMGINSGPVYRVDDINANMNVAGGGVNLAQRVMDCGDAGHILVSEGTARLLSQVGAWTDHLHDIGTTRVKHRLRLHLFSLCISEAGNLRLPRKIQRERVRRNTMVGAAVLGAFVLAAYILLRFSPLSSPQHQLLMQTQVTSNPAEHPLKAAAISPNGTYLAYVDDDGIAVRDIRSGNERRLPGPKGGNLSFGSPNWALAWFPDSSRFLVAGPVGDDKFETLWDFPLTGEASRVADRTWLPSVSSDGNYVAWVDSETETSIWVNEEGKTRKVLTLPRNDTVAAIGWSPANDRLAFVVTTPETDKDFVGTVDVNTFDTTTVAANLQLSSGPKDEYSGICWLADGRVLFVQQGSPGSRGSDVWSVPVDPRSGKVTGKPFIVSTNPGIYLSSLSATTDGKVIATLKAKSKLDIFVGVLATTPLKLEPFISEQSDNWASSWTADSKYLLYTSNRNSGVQDIYRQAINGGRTEALVPDGKPKARAMATPDGAILYWTWDKGTTDASGAPRDLKLRSEKNSPRTLLRAAPGTDELGCALAALACVVSEEGPNILQFYRLDLTRATKSFVASIQLRTADGFDWDISPNGARIAVTHSNVSDGNIRIIDLASGAISDLSVQPWTQLEGIAWKADGNGFYVSSNLPKQSALLQVDLNGKTRVLWQSGPETLDSLVPSPDGKRLAISISSTGESNAWLLAEPK